MAQPRTSDCPLCGAKIGAHRLWAAAEELIHEQLAVYAAHCPFCQGYLEIQRKDNLLNIGYLIGDGERARFDVALCLPFETQPSSP